ncbi:MAG TPA: GNAT family N-acetyltransferase [Phycisphaerae bacterium]|nr:GNAT family N-acetyltransferase [Phycisphaerae bacterium]
MQFTDEVEEYTILRLDLSDYPGTTRQLPEGFRIAGPEVRPAVRERERSLIQSHFLSWAAPYYGELPGWRDESPLYLLDGERLIGGIYVCALNQYGEREIGQLHYAYMDPAYRGRGLYSSLFAAAVARAREWGLKGLYLNSDRFMLPDVYLRWGAKPYRVHRKARNKFSRALWSMSRRAKNRLIALKHFREA